MRPYRLIYDDSCEICRAGIERIKKLDRVGVVGALPISQVEKMDTAALPSMAELRQEIHLLSPDGKISKGADAVAYVSTLLPRSRIFGRLLLLPGVRQLARPVYRLIARHRHCLSRALGRRPSSGEPAKQ